VYDDRTKVSSDVICVPFFVTGVVVVVDVGDNGGSIISRFTFSPLMRDAMTDSTMLVAFRISMAGGGHGKWSAQFHVLVFVLVGLAPRGFRKAGTSSITVSCDIDVSAKTVLPSSV
jgi:hypothetical protein